MNTSLFHVCADEHAVGAEIGPFTLTHYIQRRLSDRDFKRIEEEFDATRPVGVVSRRSAVFAFGTASECRYYWDAQKKSGTRLADYAKPPRYYRVSMLSPRRVPIGLVNYALRRLEKKLDVRPVIAEY